MTIAIDPFLDTDDVRKGVAYDVKLWPQHKWRIQTVYKSSNPVSYFISDQHLGTSFLLNAPPIVSNLSVPPFEAAPYLSLILH